MEHFRIYIDTSVLGGCFDPEFATWSNGLMRDFRARRLVPVLSDVTAAEVATAPAPVRDLHQEMLALAGTVLPVTSAVLALVARYETKKILNIFSTPNSPRYAAHRFGYDRRRRCPQ